MVNFQLKTCHLKFAIRPMRQTIFPLVFLLFPATIGAGPKKYSAEYDQYFRKYSKYFSGVSPARFASDNERTIALATGSNKASSMTLIIVGILKNVCRL